MNDLESMIRRDLHSAADDLDLQVDVDAVLARHRAARARRRWAMAAAGASGLAVISVTAWALGQGPWNDRTAVPDPLTTPSAVAPTPSPQPSLTPTPAPTYSPGTWPTPSAAPSPGGVPAGVAMTTVRVYYIDGFDGRGSPALTREPRLVPAGTPVRGAIEALIAGPDDPDSFSAWPTDTRVLGISRRDDVITVDLSGEARAANVGASFEARMVETLVWTATEAYGLPDARVRVLIEGQPAGDTWGHMVWDEPVGRGEAMDTLVPVVIDRIEVTGSGAAESAPRTVTVTGEAIAFEATVDYRVLRNGSVVTQGFATTTEGQTFAPFRVTLELPPGSYVFEMSPSDPSAGEGGPVYTASRAFTVN